ncbi:MAG: ABC transporter substrate-binding protein [Rhizobiales bacterium]|nr:ABC transporter substrate-binding protein [Hyphomicrobiales bacterium]
MSNKEHVWIPRLKQYLSDGKIGRRDFVRQAALLGMSAGVAYGWAGKITGNPLVQPAHAQELPKGGILKISMRVPKIDSPHTFSWIYDSNITRQVVGYVTRSGVDNVTRPHLCSGWVASEVLKTWTFTVADMKWHDGRPLTAEDFAWNIKRCLDASVGSSVVGLMKGYMLNEIDTDKKDEAGNVVKTTELWDASAIEVKDEKTLVLNLKEAQVAVPEHLFHYPMQILDPAEKGVFGVGSNGVMPFDLAELEVGRKAILKRRADGKAHLDEVHFIDLGDNPSATAGAMKSKQVDGLYEGEIEQFDIYKAMDHLEMYYVTTAGTAVVRMRSDSDPWKDPKVRKALRLATDAAKTNAIAAGELGTVAEHHHVCPVHPDYKQIGELARDVEKAKALLTEAGHPDGIDVEINCKPEPAWEVKSVEAMVEQWKEAGIRAKIAVLPSNKFWEVWDKVPFGFTSWAHRPLGFMVLSLAYRTGVPWNESAYSNAKFDELLTKAEGTLDVEARRELIGELEAIMHEDGPISQSTWRKYYTPMDKKVKGFELHPTRYFFCEDYAVEA